MSLVNGHVCACVFFYYYYLEEGSIVPFLLPCMYIIHLFKINRSCKFQNVYPVVYDVLGTNKNSSFLSLQENPPKC